MSLTEGRASAVCNCSVDGTWCCTFWLSQSGHRHNLASSQFWCWQSNIASLLCIRDITPFWCCQTGLVLVLLCHCRLVDRIEENNKMVIVKARVVSSQTRFSPTMTLYLTMILGYCKVHLKKKWQTCHQVPRCWPHSTVCRSPGHGIGRPGLMVTSHITDRISWTWATSLMLHNRRRGNFRFWNGCDTIQDGGGKQKLRLRLQLPQPFREWLGEANDQMLLKK